MRTNIEIDDKLMSAAMKAGGFTTKKETVEEGLRLLAARAEIAEIRKLRGKIKWTGDLREMRQDRLKYDVLWHDEYTTKPTGKRTKSAIAKAVSKTATKSKK